MQALQLRSSANCVSELLETKQRPAQVIAGGEREPESENPVSHFLMAGFGLSQKAGEPRRTEYGLPLTSTKLMEVKTCRILQHEGSE
jgi:hypothetical protein